MKAIKGVKDIRTMENHITMGKAKTPHGALVTLAAIAIEKTRLANEIQRIESRHAHIVMRLKELERQENLLFKFTSNPKGNSGRQLNDWKSIQGKVKEENPNICLSRITIKY